MCRLLAYKGPSVILDDLLYESEHSIIKQSYNAMEMDEPLNGDGFGVGWYARTLSPEPAVFASVRPAWNNQNLQYMAPKIESDCVFAHVRSASVGSVNKLNCHPFHHKNFLMMHNGGIENFEEIRRPLLAMLSDARFRDIKGQTDSEHIFALFLNHLDQLNDTSNLRHYRDALKHTVDDIVELKQQYGLQAASSLNLLITDGSRMIGSRLVTDSNEKPLSLHYATGHRFECQDSMLTIQGDPEEGAQHKAVLIASERLNEHAQNWQDIPANHYFSIDSGGTITVTSA
ncbi:MAG TPA: class II glutamine amidotransferase [Fodinibius sp.]|nr:class II glutamine amidotransferase [Fodinibius sp.]